MKNLKKMAIILIITLTLIVILSNSNVFAEDMMSIINKQAGGTADDTVTTAATKISASVITIAKVICAAIAVIMLSVLGMKYMMAAPGDKADIKKHAVIYIIGAIVMFGCTGILSIIEGFASSIK